MSGANEEITDLKSYCKWNTADLVQFRKACNQHNIFIKSEV